MSRAFTKEDDAGDDLTELPVPAGPNYVTPRGLTLLKAAVEALARRRKDTARAGGDTRPMERDLRYLEARINGATVVPPGSGEEVRFGARVVIEGEDGERETFEIVGEDEARTDARFLAWSAPLAIALLGAKAGDTVTWEGPEGSVRRRVVDVSYPAA